MSLWQREMGVFLLLRGLRIDLEEIFIEEEEEEDEDISLSISGNVSAMCLR